jgi:hypothetical protein
LAGLIGKEMKTCAYCGRENPDDATRCAECSAQEFAEPVGPTNPRYVCYWFLAAVASGLIGTALSLIVAWQELRNEPHLDWKQYQTRSQLQHMAGKIKDYQSRNGALPTAEALREALGAAPLDGWGRSFLYQLADGNFIVISYGRDGTLGGHGLDCDLTSRDVQPKASSPTFSQFYRDLANGGIMGTCLGCGALTFLTSLITLRPRPLTRRQVVRLALSIGATIIGTVVIAAFISGLHIPSH